jgi:hypothetical protein
VRKVGGGYSIVDGRNEKEREPRYIDHLHQGTKRGTDGSQGPTGDRERARERGKVSTYAKQRGERII